MESTQRTEMQKIATIRSNKWAAGAVSMLLSASLILSACGGGGDDGADEPAAESTVVATMAAPAAQATEVEDTEAETPEADAEGATETEVMTETDVVVDTNVVTDVEVITNTNVTTESTAVEVITQTEVITDVTTDTETATETETSTETETATATETTTDTEGIDAGTTTTATGSVGGGNAAAGTAATMRGVSGVEGSRYVRASSLLDSNFENMGGDVSGDLEDVMIDLATGRVLFASIEYGGVLDLGDKDIVVPMNAFALGEEGELVLNIDETTLENYPDVGNDWPDLNDPTWDDDVNAFWGEAGIDVGEGFNEATTSVARASELIGHNVGDLGAGAGSIMDILINLGTGQAPYFVVTHGEGLDEDPYIIPVAAYNTANWNAEQELAYAENFTPDLLENSPRFDMDAYPEGTDLDNQFGEGIESAWNDLGFGNNGQGN